MPPGLPLVGESGSCLGHIRSRSGRPAGSATTQQNRHPVWLRRVSVRGWKTGGEGPRWSRTTTTSKAVRISTGSYTGSSPTPPPSSLELKAKNIDMSGLTPIPIPAADRVFPLSRRPSIATSTWRTLTHTWVQSAGSALPKDRRVARPLPTPSTSRRSSTESPGAGRPAVGLYKPGPGGTRPT